MSVKHQYVNVGGRLVDFRRPWVMGIVNVTPDSFYADSRTPDLRGCRDRIQSLVAAGADCLDIGGYSTRPGADDISPDCEWQRLRLALEAARELAPAIPLSVDTFRAEVARKCVESYGVEIINDIGGGTLDADMYEAVAELGCAYVLMHTRGTPAQMQSLTDYADVTAEVLEDLAHKTARLRLLGVRDIILDPGFGFAKTVDQNFTLLAELDQFLALGLPVLAGLSRKSMIWRTLECGPEESLTGTTALNTVALLKGASILRVHDVAQARECVTLIEKLRMCTPRN